MNERRLNTGFRDCFDKAIGHCRIGRAPVEWDVYESDAGRLGFRSLGINVGPLFGGQPQVDDGCEPHVLDSGRGTWFYRAGACDGGLHLREVGDPFDCRFLNLGLCGGDGNADRDGGKNWK